ncbi:metal tolerance protein 2 isoform X1 [Selaginella moellendorffii]|uniref:metal tolerance protein 2 isoform X1 n=1 Tax=Selaginella moellendorffii TaxID=88036 RepID=UPI000D1D06E1|nr:metal tolerance protein 2 isoform X1 [Selaginella moellendorffii]|eukprot:XP_024534353.1 metal tolerance protein 2 isoform X1 [Selaginella moellendorffii]
MSPLCRRKLRLPIARLRPLDFIFKADRDDSDGGISLAPAGARTHMGHAHHHHHKGAAVGDARSKAGEHIARIGLLADSSLAVLKGSAGYLSGSTALVADAAHSFSDIVLSAVALLSIKAGRIPRDKEHPYGHGKFETLGALGISGMLLLTGCGIAWHAVEVIQSVLSTADMTTGLDFLSKNSSDHHEDDHGSSGHHHHGLDSEHLQLALSAAVTSIGVKEGLYWATKRVGETQGSQLLKANAWHHRSDAISSIVALIGVGGTMIGVPWLDPAAGIVVSGMIVKAGIGTGYHSLQELVDKGVSESVLAPIRESVLQVEGVQNCHDLRGRRAGSYVYIDAHIEVDPWLSVSAAHNIGEAVRRRIHEYHPEVAESYVHIDPAKDWKVDEAEDEEAASAQETSTVAESDANDKCSRLQPSVEKDIRNVLSSKFQDVTLKHVTCHFLKGRVVAQVEVSMTPDMLIRDAVQRAKDIEHEIVSQVPDVSTVKMQLTLKD